MDDDFVAVRRERLDIADSNIRSAIDTPRRSRSVTACKWNGRSPPVDDHRNQGAKPSLSHPAAGCSAACAAIAASSALRMRAPISGGNRPCSTTVPSSSCQKVRPRFSCWASAGSRPPMRGSRGGPLDVSGGIEIRRRLGASSRPYACARHRPDSPQPRRARTALPRPLQPSARITARGSRSMILNSVRAGPVGLRRPCSQFSRVRLLTFRKDAI